MVSPRSCKSMWASSRWERCQTVIQGECCDSLLWVQHLAHFVERERSRGEMTWKQIGENQVPKPGPVSYFQRMKHNFTRLDYHLLSAGQSNIL